MKNTWIKKCFVISIVILFISVAIAQSINQSIVKASDDNDLVEVTTQACGIQGFGNTTVKLTRGQYQNLEQYLVDFRERLNQTSTREETVPIFKDAVVELNKYGLLPKGMSVEQAQRLVTGQLYEKKYNHFFSEIHLPKNLSKYNFLSLVSGNVSGAAFLSPLMTFISYISWGHLFTNYPLLWLILWMIGVILAPVNLIIYNFIPIPISFWQSIMMIGHGSGWEETSGSVESFGLLGKKGFEGILYGLIGPLGLGIIGFTGIKIHNEESAFDYFFLGSAFAVGIDDTK